MASKRIITFFGIGAIVGSFPGVPSVQAASFDCSKAQIEVEKLICADRKLSELDDNLAIAYRGALNPGHFTRQLKRDQLEWLRARDACKDAACLKKKYEQRIWELVHSGQPYKGKDKYILERGRGNEVCEAYETNLNSFKPARPFGYGRPISSESIGFSKPTFDSWYNFETLREVLLETEKKILHFIWERDVNPVAEVPDGVRYWEGTPGQREFAYDLFKSRHLRPMVDLLEDTTPIPAPGSHIGRIDVNPMIGQVDIDNDGKPEYIHVFASDSGSSLVVLNTDATDIDYDKTKLTLQHPSRKEQGLPELTKLDSQEPEGPFGDRERGVKVTENPYRGVNYGIFYYKGKTYFDQWWNRHPDYRGQEFSPGVFKPLRVFVIENRMTREVCTYRYIHVPLKQSEM